MMLPLLTILAFAAAPPRDGLAESLAKLSEQIPSPVAAEVYVPLHRQLQQVGLEQSRQWRNLSSRADWQAFVAPRIERLRASLGPFPEGNPPPRLHIRKTIQGEGLFIDCLTFESRPGLLVTANLYRPARPGKAMPGLILCHSHHNPKSESELQDMGVLWARAGCVVLVPDLLGHGERRQHPFRTAADFPGSFRVGRQDYYFRYNLAIQLQTIGDSLMGWLVGDLRRCVDVLWNWPGIDRQRLGILGAVAGGGDPAAVTAALDSRLSAAVIFNFGGPQPETRYPLPDDAETRFLYSGSGSWESTRNLAFSARDGFLPWVIVASLAPRRLVYAHEFSWDSDRDPVWKRLRQVYAWLGASDHLASTQGKGLLSGRPPEASHCNNIGALHRQNGIYAAFQRWFAIAPPTNEPRDRRSAAELLCLSETDRPGAVHQLAATLADERCAAARQRQAGSPEQRRQTLQRDWRRLLGTIDPPASVPQVNGRDLALGEGMSARWVSVIGQPRLGGLLLRPTGEPTRRRPVVVAIAQGGPAGFLRHRSAELADRLRAGQVVLLASLGGLADQPPGAGRGRGSAATSIASSALMLGQPVLGDRLRELRILLAWIRQQDGIDARQVTLWGDSFAPINAATTRTEVPLDVTEPAQAEPLGGLLALLAGLYEDNLAEIRIRGGLVSYRSLLDSPFVHVPYDIVVPGAMTAGDLPDIAAALAPTQVHQERLVDGRNRLVEPNSRR